jgi:hypothetical protein
MRGDRRLVWLVMAHLVLGLVSGMLAPIEIRTPFGLPHIPIVPLFALTFCQVILLVFWAVFSPAAWWKRLGGLVGAVACQEALFDLSMKDELHFMPCLVSIVTVGSLLLVRGWGIRLDAPTDPVHPPLSESEGLRFSIRGLMMFTLVIALLCAGVRSLWESPGRFGLMRMTIWSLGVVAVGLVALRAVLGSSRLFPWRVALMALSPILGALVAFATSAHRAGVFYIITIMVLYPAVLLGSLLVVRSCGYRLVRRSPRRPTPAEEEERLPTDLVGEPDFGVTSIRPT